SRLDGTIMIGLVDGTCVSPVRWEDMNHKLYDSYRQNPERLKKWLESFDFGGERPNWFLYGRRTGNRDPYNNEEIKHLALDIFTPYDNNIPVYAMIVGTAAPPNYDHAIRIKGNKFSIEYSHIIPEVSVGDNVCLGQLIGYVKPDRRLPTNTHVHVGSFGTGIQQTPDIVECFPGLTKEDIVFYPIKKDGINVIGPPRLPFYDYELKQLVTPLP
ncbi:MAG: M23 family metallopeptidase, partial [Endomicrobia bacterium]|nr:M23 family metallopeptidase [Endomicrobiia bacterium]